MAGRFWQHRLDGGIDLEILVPQLQGWFDRYLKHDQAVAPVPTFSKRARWM